ncbi:hypothetical protein [Prevotella sp.]
MKDRLSFLTCIVLFILMPLTAMAQTKPKRDVRKDLPQFSMRVVPRSFSPSAPAKKDKQPQSPHHSVRVVPRPFSPSAPAKKTKQSQSSTAGSRKWAVQTKKYSNKKKHIQKGTYIYANGGYMATIVVGNKCETKYVDISTDAGQWWISNDENFWYMVRKVNNTTLAIDVSSNPSHEARHGTFYVKIGESCCPISVEQQGAPYQASANVYSVQLSHNVMYAGNRWMYAGNRCLCGNVRFGISGAGGTPVRVYAFLTNQYGSYVVQGTKNVFVVSENITPPTDDEAIFNAYLYFPNYLLEPYTDNKKMAVRFAVFSDVMGQFVSITNPIPFSVKKKRKKVVTKE